ncbi:MAG: hypothetical protein JW809_03715 [Pirellulales bacterium]|nr:hypothetical protein [Pirellulales bacterium]
MRRWSEVVSGAAGIAAVFVLAMGAGAETCKLEMKKTDPSVRAGPDGTPIEVFFRYSQPQSFVIRLSADGGRVVPPAGEEKKPGFSEVVKTEPAAYAAEEPLRGVVKLGNQYFGFVLDSVVAKEDAEAESADKPAAKPAAEPEKDAAPNTETKQGDAAKAAAAAAIRQLARLRDPAGDASSRGGVRSTALAGAGGARVPTYNRLYFDSNHNGDLTDETAIEAQSAHSAAVGYASSNFPAVDVALDFDGTKVDYSFRMYVTIRRTANVTLATGGLTAAAYREGEIAIDGKKRRVVLVDGNSNGRFDDAPTFAGVSYRTFGDMVYLIDPETKIGYGNPYDPTTNHFQHPVGKWLSLSGGLFDLTVSPAGDTLSIAPSTAPAGTVSNPNAGYRALVRGPEGALKITGDASGNAAVPVGAWQLASYTIDRTDDAPAEEPQTNPICKPARRARPAVRIAMPAARLLAPPPIPYTIASGRVTSDYKAVTVAAGKTVALPFGPPYEPVVTAVLRKGKEGEPLAAIGLTLLGAGGDRCTGLSLRGERPEKPTFVITTEDGKEVASGNFEYG